MTSYAPVAIQHGSAGVVKQLHGEGPFVGRVVYQPAGVDHLGGEVVAVPDQSYRGPFVARIFDADRVVAEVHFDRLGAVVAGRVDKLLVDPNASLPRSVEREAVVPFTLDAHLALPLDGKRAGRQAVVGHAARPIEGDRGIHPREYGRRFGSDEILCDQSGGQPRAGGRLQSIPVEIAGGHSIGVDRLVEQGQSEADRKRLAQRKREWLGVEAEVGRHKGAVRCLGSQPSRGMSRIGRGIEHGHGHASAGTRMNRTSGPGGPDAVGLGDSGTAD